MLLSTTTFARRGHFNLNRQKYGCHVLIYALLLIAFIMQISVLNEAFIFIPDQFRLLVFFINAFPFVCSIRFRIPPPPMFRNWINQVFFDVTQLQILELWLIYCLTQLCFENVNIIVIFLYGALLVLTMLFGHRNHKLQLKNTHFNRLQELKSHWLLSHECCGLVFWNLFLYCDTLIHACHTKRKVVTQV